MRPPQKTTSARIFCSARLRNSWMRTSPPKTTTALRYPSKSSFPIPWKPNRSPAKSVCPQRYWRGFGLGPQKKTPIGGGGFGWGQKKKRKTTPPPPWNNRLEKTEEREMGGGGEGVGVSRDGGMGVRPR